jgi:hypothetical protein
MQIESRKKSHDHFNRFRPLTNSISLRGKNVLEKIGIEVSELNIIKTIDDKSRASIILNGGNQPISSKTKKKTRVYFLSSLIQCSA